MYKTNLYVLKLQAGRYFVGTSDDVLNAFREHRSGEGCEWTRRYRPVALYKTHYNVNVFEEDKVTKEFMALYGIDKVRGGAYTSVELDSFQRMFLEMEIQHASKECLNCGYTGHTNQNCLVNPSDKAKGSCYRCGRFGHQGLDCSAERTVDGYCVGYDSEEL